MDILIEKYGVDTQQLTAQLKDALGDKVDGISTGPYGVIVHFVSARPSTVDLMRADELVTNHTPDTAARDAEQSAREQQAAADDATLAAFKAGQKVAQADVLAAMMRKLGLV